MSRPTMTLEAVVVEQGDLALLRDPVAATLLSSREYARLAYVWPDGTPRVVPIWFHWTGEQIVLGTPPRAPKLKALAQQPRVAVSIDSSGWPAKVLMIRGDATVELMDDVVPEYTTAAGRYFGDAAEGWIAQLRGQQMARIAITPRWVGILDFETRFPSALSV